MNSPTYFETPQYARNLIKDNMMNYLQHADIDYLVSTYCSVITLLKVSGDRTSQDYQLMLGGTVRHVKYSIVSHKVDFNFVLHTIFMQMFDPESLDLTGFPITYQGMIARIVREVSIDTISEEDKFDMIKRMIDVCTHVYDNRSTLPSSLYEMVDFMVATDRDKYSLSEYFDVIVGRGNYMGSVSKSYIPFLSEVLNRMENDNTKSEEKHSVNENC